jgi:glycosyltransferase involved in cell wall biosynthesis
MTPYVLVSNDAVRTGGMDWANYALAAYLADQGHEVHLVAHRIDPGLLAHPNVRPHHVPKIANSYLLGGPLLDRVGRYWAAKIARRGGRVLVNGGNCRYGDANWVHYVHAAYTPRVHAGLLHRLKNRVAHRRFLWEESQVLHRAKVVLANSERTRRDLIERLGLPGPRVFTVYYGTDPDLFRPADPAERATVRAQMGWPADTPYMAFIGGLGDDRKGFDTLFTAWLALCQDPAWDARLVVIGTGASLPAWRARAAAAGVGARVQFLGFRTDVPDLLRACDALVAPTRYEAYGLGVQEALCCGLPALVTRTAGVAERYPSELHDLLLPDPDDPGDLVARLRAWRAGRHRYREPVRRLADTLRAYTWRHMAARITSILDGIPCPARSL